MKSEDLIIEDVIDFSSGHVSLKGRRLILQDMRAFSQLRKDLADSVGKEHTRRILTRFGYFWGHADAAAMKRIFSWDNKEEWLRAGAKIKTIQGISRSVIKSLHFTPEGDEFNMEVLWHNSFEAEQHLAEFGPADYPVCWILVSYASGYTSFCMEREIYFIEEKCRAAGDRVCKAVGKTREEWGSRIRPYLKYYQAEDIHGKIMKLTRRLERQQRELRRQRREMLLVDPAVSGDFVGVRSRSFRRVVDLAAKVSRFNTTVLITGESGVGKEVLARYIHKQSPRAKKPFLAINCGALPDTLLESELFGHTKGAFTGAAKDRIGIFEEAKGGTVFLDEIGDVSPAMQIKLLRVLQEREILRLGENTPRKIDVRVISATNRDLAKEIEEENFREDLYYRVAVVEVNIPPLRERKEDILPLARYFVKRFSRKLKIPNLKLDPSTLDVLQEYSWPGNIRELENAIERGAVVCQNGQILPENLPSGIYRAPAQAGTFYSPDMSLEEVENTHIKNVLEHADGNKTKAAKILDISSATLWRKIKRLEI